ncbi:MAG: hypothetical protein ABWZ02_14200 [Nakamurella sp.]
MFKSWRRILTLKALALSLVLLAALVATAVVRRRRPGSVDGRPVAGRPVDGIRS